MGRKNIFDMLADKININTELKRISTLFNSVITERVDDYEATIENIIDKDIFPKWKSRGTYLNCRDMRSSLELLLNKSKIRKIDKILGYLEYYINVITLIRVMINLGKYGYKKSTNFNMLTDNIKKLLDNLNHQQILIRDEEKRLIIPKNPAGTAAAEVSSLHTGVAILKYHHRLLQGDLPEKRKILETIATEYEEMLKSGEPSQIFDKTKGLLNNLGIRHGNKTNKENVAKFSTAELEKWYDEVYQMLLLCILLNENKPRMQKVDKLLKRLKHQ